MTTSSRTYVPLGASSRSTASQPGTRSRSPSVSRTSYRTETWSSPLAVVPIASSIPPTTRAANPRRSMDCTRSTISASYQKVPRLSSVRLYVSQNRWTSPPGVKRIAGLGSSRKSRRPVRAAVRGATRSAITTSLSMSAERLKSSTSKRSAPRAARRVVGWRASTRKRYWPAARALVNVRCSNCVSERKRIVSCRRSTATSRSRGSVMNRPCSIGPSARSTPSAICARGRPA